MRFDVYVDVMLKLLIIYFLNVIFLSVHGMVLCLAETT